MEGEEDCGKVCFLFHPLKKGDERINKICREKGTLMSNLTPTYTQTEGANLQNEILSFDHPYHP